jgi:hypothetical protein
MKHRRPLAVVLAALLFSGSLVPVVLAVEDDGSDGDAISPRENALAVGPVEIPVWLVTFMKSMTGGAIQTCTVISVTNQGTQSCPTSVDFLFGDGILACTTTQTVEPGETWDHCSRDVKGAIVTCNATCRPGLTLAEGRAIVRTTAACKPKIAVYPRVYYTSAGDGAVQAIANVNVVRINKANAGD